MLRPDLQPYFLDEQQCKEFATRQMLSFITFPDSEIEPPPHVRPASGESLFSFNAIPDKAFGDRPELFNWKSRDIYDVDGLLLFRDQTLDLGSGNEWHVRVAANSLLREQVWCTCAYAEPEPNRSLKVLVENALAVLRGNDSLEPFIVADEENVRLVAYNYPRLGILCYSRADHDARFVLDIENLTVISLEQQTPSANSESVTAVWSPYDAVNRSTAAHFCGLWQRNLLTLPALPESHADLPDDIREAENFVLEQHIVNPMLTPIAQESDAHCAAATAQMILAHYDLNNRSQAEVADLMQTGPTGAKPEDQLTGLNEILKGSPYIATLDNGPTYAEALDELRADRPLKTGGPIHARAVAGFRVETNGKKWLYIFDPRPTGQGSICCEIWDEAIHKNFMYVRPR